MAFDPDKYLAKKSDFNPDAYLKAPEEKPKEKNWAEFITNTMREQTHPERPDYSSEGLLRGSLAALPAAGAIGGGLLGAPAGPGGMLGGGMLGAGMGKSLEQLGKTYLLGDEPQSLGQNIKDIGEEMALEGAFQGAGSVIGKGLKSSRGLLTKYVKEPVEQAIMRFAPKLKESAPLVQESAERLGITPTRGMLTEGADIHRLESTLSQSPTNAGMQKREQMEGIQKAMRKGADDAFGVAKEADPIGLGSGAKKTMAESIEQELKPAVKVYEDIASDAQHIPIESKSTNLIAKNIENLPYAKIKGSPESSFATQISENLRNVTSREELRTLRTYVGKQFQNQSLSPTQRELVGDIYQRLSKLEQNSITRAALESARNAQHGKAIATEMIKDMKAANKTYSTVSKKMQQTAENFGLGKVRSPGEFIARLNAVPDEQLASKIFKMDDYASLSQFQKEFPQAFETLRTAKMGEIYKNSLVKGEISIAKLIQNTKRLNPQSRKLLFGDGSDQMLKDVETIYNSIPQKIGPSGTPEGMVWSAGKLIDPRYWFQTVHDGMVDYALKNPQFFENFAQKTYAKRMAAEASKNNPAKMLTDYVKTQAPISVGGRMLGVGQDE